MEGTLSLFDWRPAPGLELGSSAGAGAPAPAARSGGGIAAGRSAPRRGARAALGPERGGAGGRRAAAAAPRGRAAGPGRVAAPPPAAAAASAGDSAVPELLQSAIGSGAHPGGAAGTASALPAASAARVIVFDCETTGTDRAADQIIELCVQLGLADDAPHQTWRIRPTVPIHPGAQAVHGISEDELVGCPAFAELADAIVAVFADADVIVGYNLAFDIEMLQAELARAGRPLLELGNKQIVDAFRLWQQCEPRSLQHAHQRFVGAEFACAHSASADVAATGRVLAGMLRAFHLDGQDWAQIAHVCDPGRASWLGPSRHLRWEGDVIVLGFGKHANAPLHEVAGGPDRGFLRWVIDRPVGRDFPPHVVEVCRAALELPRDELVPWARRRFGAAPPPPAPPPGSGAEPAPGRASAGRRSPATGASSAPE